MSPLNSCCSACSQHETFFFQNCQIDHPWLGLLLCSPLAGHVMTSMVSRWWQSSSLATKIWTIVSGFSWFWKSGEIRIDLKNKKSIFHVIKFYKTSVPADFQFAGICVVVHTYRRKPWHIQWLINSPLT